MMLDWSCSHAVNLHTSPNSVPDGWYLEDGEGSASSRLHHTISERHMVTWMRWRAGLGGGGQICGRAGIPYILPGEGMRPS
jgi:hypothetical protein